MEHKKDYYYHRDGYSSVIPSIQKLIAKVEIGASLLEHEGTYLASLSINDHKKIAISKAEKLLKSFSISGPASTE